jgi:hypothetical protein
MADEIDQRSELTSSVLRDEATGGCVLPLRVQFAPGADVGEPIAVHAQLTPIPVRIRADRGLMNLAVNAKGAMPEGGVLTITTAECRISADWRGCWGHCSCPSCSLRWIW